MKGYLQNGIAMPIFYFYEGLIVSKQARNIKSKKFIKTIEMDISSLKQVADNTLMSYLHKGFLLEAKLAVI